MTRGYWDFSEFRLPINEKTSYTENQYEFLSQFVNWYLNEREINLEEGESVLLTMTISSKHVTLADFIKELSNLQEQL